MNREDIIRMAREAGFHIEDDDYGNPMLVTDSGDLIKFAQLVAAHEREEILSILDRDWFITQADVQEMIRARSK